MFMILGLTKINVCQNTKVRVGRSAFFFFAERDFAQKMVKKCGVFRVIFVLKTDLLGSGPFSRDCRVTGNKHIFLLGLILYL